MLYRTCHRPGALTFLQMLTNVRWFRSVDRRTARCPLRNSSCQKSACSAHLSHDRALHPALKQASGKCLSVFTSKGGNREERDHLVSRGGSSSSEV